MPYANFSWGISTLNKDFSLARLPKGVKIRCTALVCLSSLFRLSGYGLLVAIALVLLLGRGNKSQGKALIFC